MVLYDGSLYQLKLSKEGNKNSKRNNGDRNVYTNNNNN